MRKCTKQERKEGMCVVKNIGLIKRHLLHHFDILDNVTGIGSFSCNNGNFHFNRLKSARSVRTATVEHDVVKAQARLFVCRCR